MTLLPGNMTADGLERTYLIHLPLGFEPGKTYPLLLSLHGRMDSGKDQAKLSRFNHIADREGFIVVYPDGFKTAKRGWADGRGRIMAGDREVDDVIFIEALLDKLLSEYPIDEGRVYSCGISNGGFMSIRLGCDLSDRFTAVAAVGATFGSDIASRCTLKRPVSVMIIMGTDDPVIKFEGGIAEISDFRGEFLSARDALNRWAELNGCMGDPVTKELPSLADDGTRVSRISYGPCSEGTEVILYIINGGGHTWPGGPQYLPEKIVGRVCRDIDASEIIWEFFKSKRKN